MHKTEDPLTIRASRKSFRLSGIVGLCMNFFASERREAKHMELVETLVLGGKKQLHLVICDGERFLIGVGGDRIQAVLRVGGDATQSPEQIF